MSRERDVAPTLSSMFEPYEEPTEVLAVLVYAVVLCLDMLLLKKTQYCLLQLPAALARNYLHQWDAVLHRLIDHPVQFGIYLLSLVEDLMQVEHQFCHEANVVPSDEAFAQMGSDPSDPCFCFPIAWN